MAGHGWKYQRDLHNVARDGLNRLSSQEYKPKNTLGDELLLDLIPLAVGLLIYVQLDIRPLLPITLPESIDTPFYRTLVAGVALALVAYGGFRLVFALGEALVNKILRLVTKITRDRD
jgi:hypothetical protein